ncbi:L,D-transpeptidase [Dictyobacter kobayashii]|uniref:L,D-TPase catalytic domain-containing protein n=1 Tax=Dictyobacter kobayashii TaxID=2014872 RepID=A0A402AII0_9CHLR|nr:L,D-transpeptidase [Dictyobacter kobayashii]GCE18931.1 hypothetical protein KDK_27310 [Dictyobacter kobayashii]
MQKNLKKMYILGLSALLLALLFTVNPLNSKTTYAATATKTIATVTKAVTTATQSGTTTGYTNVRAGTNTGARILTTYAPYTPITIYARVIGQGVWSGNNIWYRISANNAAPRYVYSGLVTIGSNGGSNSGGGTNVGAGKVVIVNRTTQWAYFYENGRQVRNSPITTGQPGLETPLGVYHVFVKLSPTTFYSPWPYGSPYWYAPTHINYALEFKEGGFFLHDAWWRSVYGPGTNVYHHDPVDGWMTGTHGCVTMPFSVAQWLYNWAPMGTTVKIVA